LRERQVTGRVRNEYGLSSTATFTDATQLLLLDLENPATMPVVLDLTIWPVPKNLSYGTNPGGPDDLMLVPQESGLGVAPGLAEKFDRYLVFSKNGRLYVVDLLKNGQFPKPRQVSKVLLQSATLNMARFDRARPERSFVAVQADVGDGPRTYYVRLDMSPADDPLAELPFDPLKPQWRRNGSSFQPIVAADGSPRGGFVAGPAVVSADQRSTRVVVQHLDTAGRVVREFATGPATAASGLGDGLSVLFDRHPWLVWPSAEASVLGLPPGPAGIAASGSLVLYRPTTGELAPGGLPALPLPGVDLPFFVLAEDARALFVSEGYGGGRDPGFALSAFDKQSSARAPVRPELDRPQALFNRWPFLLVVEPDQQVSSIDLSLPEFPIRRLLKISAPLSQSPRSPEVAGLSADTLVLEDPRGTVQVLALAGGPDARPDVRFQSSHFLGWAANYSTNELHRPQQAGRLLTRRAGSPTDGWSAPDGESLFDQPQRSVLPTHFLLVGDGETANRVTGVDLTARTTVGVGSLPAGWNALPAYPAAPRPAYAGRWVIFHALGPSVPCATIPAWIEVSFDGQRPCTQRTTDLFIADPTLKDSLRKISAPATLPSL